MAKQAELHTAVAIVGAGPSGLMLAIELGCRGIPCVLLETQPLPPAMPKANATSARTMEHYRRRGFAERVRAAGLAPDHPQDVLYCTRLAGHEIARFRIPSRLQAQRRAGLDDYGDYGEDAWPTPELPHRVQQTHVEPILRDELRRFASVDARYGVRADAVQALPEGVRIEAVDAASGERLVVRACHAVGCDGPRSVVRAAMAVNYEGASREQREFFGGQMLTLHFRSADLYACFAQGPLQRKAWQTWVMNPELRGILVAINGVDEFVIGMQLKPGQGADSVDPARVFALLSGGRRFGHELLHTGSWTAGYTLVAERFRAGPLFIAGDAAHLFTPTGGMGYNTSVDDAVNLGWKLAAVHEGWAPDALLDTYHDERHPVALRNTRFARRMADSIGRIPMPANLEAEDAEGALARAQLGQALLRHGVAEFNIPGLQLGLRYESAIVATEDRTAAPPDDPNVYVPSAFPGARAPHVALDGGGAALFDRFGRDFTLLCLAEGLDTRAWLAAAAELGMPLQLTVHADPAALALYAADAVLVRPDHHVAWRGRAGDDAGAVLRRAIGRTLDAGLA